MALAAGSRLGPYDIAAPLGAGGMGEVYRARDARLSRDVAIKVLPPSFAADAERLRRFELEARATGQLNHPNILQVYDLGMHEGAPYVVTELLQGATLRERIAGTALPVRKAIEIATQIARGLAAAHDKGIVHRDLKPDNVFVTGDGRVKILDFGLAKLAQGDALAEAETNTRGVPGTDAGKVLGTVGYMSPEQVRARPVDHRSDIFSFGSVLYEMLSGKRAFRGASAVETMNAILKEDPPELSASNRHLPPALERIVGHCLEKDPEERFQSARDIAFDLDQLSGSASTHLAPASPTSTTARWRRAAPFALSALALVALGYLLPPRDDAPPVAAFSPLTFQKGLVTDARFAPDGTTIVFQAIWPGSDRDIYVTRPGSPESRSLGLKNSGLAAVSRSGELLILRGDAGGSTLAQVPMDGGAPRDILQDVTWADWGPDGATIAVVRVSGSRQYLEYPIGKTLHEAISMKHLRVSPDGDLVAFSEHPIDGDHRGDIAIVDASGKKKTLSSNWADIRGIAWSPDRREIWFTATRSGGENSVWAVTPQGRERPVFRAPGSLALEDTAPDGRVLASVQGLRPQILGLGPGETRERDLSWLDYGIAIDVSADGRTLLFVEQGEGGGPDYTAYIRGMDGSVPVRLGKGNAVALSPDGKQALVITVNVPMQAILLPTGAGQARTLPRGALVQFHAAGFLPDGKSVLFYANETGHSPRLYLQDLAGGEPKPISTERILVPLGVRATPDGAFAAGVWERRIWLYPTAGGEPRSVPASASGDEPLRFSADGRFLYVVNNGTNRGRQIFRVDLVRNTRELWKDLGRGGGAASFFSTIAMAPDGKSYAYTLRDDTSTLYLASGLR